jgi:hypothetical protein
MTRAAFLVRLASFAPLARALPAQMLMMGEASEGFVSLFNGQDLGRWEGDEQQWKVERPLLRGTSDGKSAAGLVLTGREYGDFDLRFDLRVTRGAGGVRIRGANAGPSGVELEAGAEGFRWLVNGSLRAVIAPLAQGRWNACRITAGGDRFEVFLDSRKPAHTSVVERLAPRGRLSLTMPSGVPSDIAFRNIRLRE